MISPDAIEFFWDGDAMVPHDRFKRVCNKRFVVGEHYRMVVEEKRSTRAHGYYFASVNEAWKNLPEDLAERFPSAEHLRKWALCKAGFASERSIVLASPEDARRVAAYIRPADPFAVIVVAGNVVRTFHALSQSTRSMSAEQFKESSRRVLDVIAELLGSRRSEIENHGKSV